MEEINISKSVSRFVIPFYFGYEDNGYDSLRNYFISMGGDSNEQNFPDTWRWKEKPFWENYNTDAEGIPEVDIYAYLLRTMVEHP